MPNKNGLELPRRITVRDYTVDKLNPASVSDVVGLIALFVGERIDLKCLRGNPSACRTNKDGPCQSCVAEDRLKVLVSQGDPWTVGKLNQILQLLGLDVVSSDFFEAFWGAETGDDGFFKLGLAQFRAYAMLIYGSFAYAYQRLGRSRTSEIMERLGEWGAPTAAHENRFRDRTHGTRLRQDIPKPQRWHVGYLSSQQLTEDLAMAVILKKARDGSSITSDESMKYNALSDDEKRWWRKPGQLEKAIRHLTALETELSSVRTLATANTTAYLVANHIDVYVATSMRERAEFEAASDFLSAVEKSRHLRALKDVTFFDPTDSFAADRIDKGLVEALMLRRAGCTVYMVQETDTLGKDSELAATLAWGKAVIAYVPDSVEHRVFAESHAYLYRRAAALLGEGRFKGPQEQQVIAALGHMQQARSALQLAGDARRPLTKSHRRSIDFLKTAAAEAELAALNNRAGFLRSRHPLALQVVQRNGVANGVLVVRNADDCAKLVQQALTFAFEFDVRENDVLTDGKPSGTLLIERVSGCPFRVVTAHSLLTNSFWTRYVRGEEGAETVN